MHKTKKTYLVEVSTTLGTEYEIETESQEKAIEIAKNRFADEQDVWPGDVDLVSIEEILPDPENEDV